MLILDVGPGTIHWNDYREGTVSKLSGGEMSANPRMELLTLRVGASRHGPFHWMRILGWSLIEPRGHFAF